MLRNVKAEKRHRKYYTRQKRINIHGILQRNNMRKKTERKFLREVSSGQPMYKYTGAPLISA